MIVFKDNGVWINGEKQMTNRERAEEIGIEAGITYLGDPKRKELLNILERALDEAEKRGRDGYHSELMKESARIDLEHYIRGQKEMRERAAKSCEEKRFNRVVSQPHLQAYDIAFQHAASDIRALPIEGEK